MILFGPTSDLGTILFWVLLIVFLFPGTIAFIRFILMLPLYPFVNAAAKAEEKFEKKLVGLPDEERERLEKLRSHRLCLGAVSIALYPIITWIIYLLFPGWLSYDACLALYLGCGLAATLLFAFVVIIITPSSFK